MHMDQWGSWKKSYVNFFAFLFAQILIPCSSKGSLLFKESTLCAFHCGHILVKKIVEITLGILDNMPVKYKMSKQILLGVIWKSDRKRMEQIIGNLVVVWINSVLCNLSFKRRSVLSCHPLWKVSSARGNLVKTLHMIENTSLKLRSLNYNRVAFYHNKTLKCVCR